MDMDLNVAINILELKLIASSMRYIAYAPNGCHAEPPSVDSMSEAFHLILNL